MKCYLRETELLNASRFCSGVGHAADYLVPAVTDDNDYAPRLTDFLEVLRAWAERSPFGSIAPVSGRHRELGCRLSIAGESIVHSLRFRLKTKLISV